MSKAVAHLDSELLCESLGGTPERSVVCYQQQTASVFDPIAYGFTFFIGEGGLVCPLVVHFLCTERVRNHQDLKAAQRFFGKRFSISNKPVAIAEDEIREGFVTTIRGVKVVVCLVEKKSRSIL